MCSKAGSSTILTLSLNLKMAHRRSGLSSGGVASRSFKKRSLTAGPVHVRFLLTCHRALGSSKSGPNGRITTHVVWDRGAHRQGSARVASSCSRHWHGAAHILTVVPPAQRHPTQLTSPFFDVKSHLGSAPRRRTVSRMAAVHLFDSFELYKLFTAQGTGLALTTAIGATKPFGLLDLEESWRLWLFRLQPFPAPNCLLLLLDLCF